LITEVVMTFMFLIVILGTTHRRAPVGFAGIRKYSNQTVERRFYLRGLTRTPFASQALAQTTR
jgi:glycerol uptake facilitator-like aquaporin